MSLARAINKKLAKAVAKYFPLNTVRLLGLRWAGYDVGRDVYVGEEFHVTDDLFEAEASLSIGDRASIAQRVLVVLCSHANHSRVSAYLPSVVGDVTIGRDAWVGAGAIILPNVTIGECSVVGAGAVVTRDVPPYSVAVGTPATVVRSLR